VRAEATAFGETIDCELDRPTAAAR
jgi:hypothetical protein